jgi:hypothetical protein
MKLCATRLTMSYRDDSIHTIKKKQNSHKMYLTIEGKMYKIAVDH